MTELIVTMIMRIFGIFIDKAAEKAAWEKAIRARLKELDSSGGDSARIHTEYDDLQNKLKEKSNAKVGGNP
jgi:hypothetical protein